MDIKRLVTGIILICVVVLIAIVDSTILTWLFLGVAYMFSFYEAMKLFGVEDNSLYFYAALIWVISYFYPAPADLIFIVLIVSVSIMVYQGKPDFNKIKPFLYPSASFLFFFALYKGFGIEAVIWLVLIVALTDTSAYFVGRAIGKNQFCEVSPKKTWEGVIGGVLIATIAGTYYGHEFVSIYLSFFISIMVAFASVFGDLFESYLKRSAGVKDSGTILPGHGGVLDRMDGYMFATVAMVVLMRGLA